MTKLHYLLIVITLGVIFSSCSDDETVTPEQAATYEGTWYLTEITQITDAGGETNVTYSTSEAYEFTFDATTMTVTKPDGMVESISSYTISDNQEIIRDPILDDNGDGIEDQRMYLEVVETDKLKIEVHYTHPDSNLDKGYWTFTRG